MWIAKLVIKHNCLIGNKCKKYKVSTISVPFDIYVENNVTYSPEFHTLWGEKANIKKFIAALQKDKHIQHVEVDGNKVFLVEVTRQKIPVTIRAHLKQKIIWIAPIHINIKGEEHWDIASWEKQHLMNFIRETEKISEYVLVKSISQTKLHDIYYTRLLPDLSEKQKAALTLAFAEGYYDWPRKTDFKALASKSNLSVSTFREHLKKAEKKILPDLIKQL
jgi:predicted DNA binding protein